MDEGKIKLKPKSVSTLILKDAKANCTEKLKADSEALFIDPITKNGYMIQKVRARNEVRSPVIFKVLFDEKMSKMKVFRNQYHIKSSSQ